jgi:septum formation protein
MTAFLVLASRSPQRRAILEQLGVAFEVRAAQVAESSIGKPSEVVQENAVRKARAVAGKAPRRVVLGADTLVVAGERTYGKPADENEARSHVERLSGRTHEVWSGVALVDGDGERVASACTRVTFRDLDEEILRWYLGSGEWRERAGSYAIQGRGAALVERVEGDFWNVVGLPVAPLIEIAPELLRAKSAQS